MTARHFFGGPGASGSCCQNLKGFWTKDHKRYVEPFAGSACLFFALSPPKAILGDLNPELISTYIEVKYRLPAVLKELAELPPWNKEEYLRLRSLDTLKTGSVKRGRPASSTSIGFALTGYTGQISGGNSTFLTAGTGAAPCRRIEVFSVCSRRLRGARFVNGDFEKVLSQAERGDLVYMDPPYAVRARRVFREYDPSAFTHEDIARLRSWMMRLNAAGISFLVSYAESDEADVLKKGFSYETIPVRRNVAGFAAHRALTNELLISNA